MKFRYSAGIAALLLLFVVAGFGWWRFDRNARLDRARAASVTVEVLIPENARNPSDGSDVPMLRPTNGSGFVMDSRGHVITNAHVVMGAARITIRMADGSRRPARLVGLDRRSDVAVVRIEGPLPQPVDLAKTAPDVGDAIFVVSSPLGYAGSLNRCEVSGSGRALRSAAPAWLIQHNAPVNPGSSGSALFNTAGEVIGINAALPDTQFDYAGIVFAVSADVVRLVAEQLIRSGHMTWPELGMAVRANDQALQSALPHLQAAGVVQAVLPGGAADRASVRPGDLIIAWNGVPVTGLPDFLRRQWLADPADVVRLRLLRSGRFVDVIMTPGLMVPPTPRAGVLAVPVGIVWSGAAPRVGSVAPGSLADLAGLIPGDVIKAVNMRSVSTVAQADRALRVSGPIAVNVIRANGQFATVVLGITGSRIAAQDANIQSLENANV